MQIFRILINSIHFALSFSFFSLLGKFKRFDAYGLLGCGVTYRDNKHIYDVTETTIYDDDITPSLNAALGANLWLTKLMGINFEGQAKFATDPYLLNQVRQKKNCLIELETVSFNPLDIP